VTATGEIYLTEKTGYANNKQLGKEMLRGVPRYGARRGHG
jgi:hypothetical protein